MSTRPRCRKPSFEGPNRLIQDGALSFSARRVGAVLYSHRNRLGACKRSLAYLAKQACCSVTTVRKAPEELEDAKYITQTKNRRCQSHVSGQGAA
ncbi:MAG: helix-turn-helix domain-containing protein [Bacillota bacterium]